MFKLQQNQNTTMNIIYLESQDSNDNMNIEVGLENSNQNNQENSFCCTVLRAMSSSIDEVGLNGLYSRCPLHDND